MKLQSIPEGLIGKELFRFLASNKALIFAEKKMAIKKADAISIYSSSLVDAFGNITKSEDGVTKATVAADTEDVIYRTTVINTTNWFDSHEDVHIDGLWKKSLSENKSLYLLEEHKMSFRTVITEEVKAYTKKVSWRDLGYNIDGITEALIFDNKIEKDPERNGFMFDQYKKNRVKNHSVGMRYVDLEMAINDSDYKDEYGTWNKYIDRIANKEAAEENGYFFAVKQARVIEGSAVVVGSNIMTPTLPTSLKSDSTDEQPSSDTVDQPQKFDIAKAIMETKFLNF